MTFTRPLHYLSIPAEPHVTCVSFPCDVTDTRRERLQRSGRAPPRNLHRRSCAIWNATTRLATCEGSSTSSGGFGFGNFSRSSDVRGSQKSLVLSVELAEPTVGRRACTFVVRGLVMKYFLKIIKGKFHELLFPPFRIGYFRNFR